MARLLLEHGADVNRHDMNENTALGLAIYSRQTGVAQLLRNAGGSEY